MCFSLAPRSSLLSSGPFSFLLPRKYFCFPFARYFLVCLQQNVFYHESPVLSSSRSFFLCFHPFYPPPHPFYCYTPTTLYLNGNNFFSFPSFPFCLVIVPDFSISGWRSISVWYTVIRESIPMLIETFYQYNAWIFYCEFLFYILWIYFVWLKFCCQSMFETPDFETSPIANFTFGNLPTYCSRLAICRLVELASLSLLGKIRCISWTKFSARQSTMYFFSSNCSRAWLGGKLLVLFVLVSNTSVVSSPSSAKKKPQQNTEDPLKHINKTVQARKFLNLRVLSNWIRVHFVSESNICVG